MYVQYVCMHERTLCMYVCMYVCMYERICSERTKVMRDRVNMNEQEARIGSLLNTLVGIH